MKIQETFNKALEEPIFLKSESFNFRELGSYKRDRNRGQTAEARRTKILQPVEQKPHSQKIDKMKRQRAMYQMKEQDKTPEKQLNEMEIGNLPEKEFRIMIVKMIQDLGKRMEAKME